MNEYHTHLGTFRTMDGGNSSHLYRIPNLDVTTITPEMRKVYRQERDREWSEKKPQLDLLCSMIEERSRTLEKRALSLVRQAEDADN